MNARYALINATPRIAQLRSMVGEGKRKKKRKKKKRRENNERRERKGPKKKKKKKKRMKKKKKGKERTQRFVGQLLRAVRRR